MLDFGIIKDIKHNINQHKCQAKLDKCVSCQCIVNYYCYGRIVHKKYVNGVANGLRPVTDVVFQI